MKTIQIWHCKKPTFCCADKNPVEYNNIPELYEHVSDVTTVIKDLNSALESAYEISQNIDTAWREPPCRSTSVGDLMIVMDTTCNVGTDVYEVNSFGFIKLS